MADAAHKNFATADVPARNKAVIASLLIAKVSPDLLARLDSMHLVGMKSESKGKPMQQPSTREPWHLRQALRCLAKTRRGTPASRHRQITVAAECTAGHQGPAHQKVDATAPGSMVDTAESMSSCAEPSESWPVKPAQPWRRFDSDRLTNSGLFTQCDVRHSDRRLEFVSILHRWQRSRRQQRESRR